MKLRAAVFASLLPFVAACDPAVDGLEPDSSEDADDGDADADAGDETDPLDVDVDPGDDGDADPNDMPTDDLPHFDNDPAEVMQALDGMRYVCSTEGTYYNVAFRTGGEVLAEAEDGTQLGGGYSVSGDTITLSFPDFVESSVAYEIEADTLATFTTPSLFCHAIALHPVAVYESAYVSARASSTSPTSRTRTTRSSSATTGA